MKGKAAVSYGSEEFTIEDVFYEDISADEVLVKIKAVGICHTDVASTKSIYPFTYPVVLGHEGAGIIEKVGENVESFESGDHVVLIYAHCNHCQPCQSGKPYICENFYTLNTNGTTYQEKKKISLANGEKLSNFFGQSSFAEYAIVHKNNLVKVPKNLPLEYLGPLACSIMTGFGSVIEKLKPSQDESIAVFGCGTVGLSAIIASKLLGCSTIIAVDINDKKLKHAKKFGATHVINSAKVDVVEAIKSIVPKGVNNSVESTGIPSVLPQTIDCLSIPGKAAVLSAVKYGTKIEIAYKAIQTERTLMGTVMGSVNPKVFIPKLIQLYEENKLPLEDIVAFYPFDQINEAIKEIEDGLAIKAVLKL